MAYISSEARAAELGDYGRGGCGYAGLTWHNMPDAKVELLPSQDSRGDVEIRWKLNTLEGVAAALTVSEARALRDKLSKAIAEFAEGIDSDVDDTTAADDDGSDVSTPQVSSYAQQLLNGIIAPTIPELPGSPKRGA